MRTRLAPEERKEIIMSHALIMARKDGYENVRREELAVKAGVSPGLVSKYWGTMPQLKRAMIREAIKREDLTIIGQGLARKDRHARKASPELKERALAQLASV